MTKQEQIKEFIAKEYPDLSADITERNNLLIAQVSYALYNAGITTHTIEYRETEQEVWLQAEYYSATIRHSIIIDYNVSDVYDNLDAFIETVADYQEQVDALEAKIAIKECLSMAHNEDIDKHGHCLECSETIRK